MDPTARRCVALVQLVNKCDRSQEVEAAAPTVHPPSVRPFWQVPCFLLLQWLSVANQSFCCFNRKVVSVMSTLLYVAPLLTIACG